MGSGRLSRRKTIALGSAVAALAGLSACKASGGVAQAQTQTAVLGSTTGQATAQRPSTTSSVGTSASSTAPASQMTTASQLATSSRTTAQTAQPGAAVDWKAVGGALGKAGQLMAGDVYRVGLPRTDLNVTVGGVPVQPALALGSYAAFKSTGDQAMVMGDLVLLDQEVQAVVDGLFAGGLSIDALHNHLNEMSPHVMYMHYSGMGDPVQLATALKKALGASATPFGGSSAATASAGPQLDTKQIEGIVGHTGTMAAGGVFQVSIPRAEKITEDGLELPPAMGTAIALNFQPTSDGKAAITGDYVLVGTEVNPVARALRQNGIQVTALHSHALADEPRLFYVHFWANDDAVQLAKGLRAALDKTKSAKPSA